MEPEKIRLIDLKPGESGRVTKVLGDKGIRRRILDMGVHTGTIIKIVRNAPLGDPIEFEVKDYHLSLRRNEAATVYLVKETP